MNHPVPLPEHTILADRFEVGRVLGRGGFGITYLARDLARGEDCAVKELAPAGIEREADGSLALPTLGHAAAQRLKHQFLQEARLLQRLGVSGVLPVRAAFSELGTAYYATEYVPDAISLDRLLQREGRMDAHGALDILLQVLETLEGLHSAGVLHRDVKPSNILVRRGGETILIDFGSARAWHADRALRHTVQYTPGYAPIEQLSDQAPRGPATDLYGLCATAYALLTGAPPPSAEERAAGAPLPTLRAMRPDVEPAVAAAIEAGLALRFEERPQSVAEFRTLLSTKPGGRRRTLAEIDEAIGRVKRFRVRRRECPACGGVLEEPRPLKTLGCPVCRSGTIVRRQLAVRLCPSCRIGVLQAVRNGRPLSYCPICRVGRLATKGVLGRIRTCASCRSEFEGAKDAVRLRACPPDPNRVGEALTWDEWRQASGRSVSGWQCDACEAQFDDLPDGTRRLVHPLTRRGEPSRLYPDEWALVAQGLDPGSGNAECSSCGADYYTDSEGLTLLAYHEDPFGLGRAMSGQWLSLEQARWRAVGKSSPARGLVCGACRTEFDGSGEGSLRLVATPSASLRAGVGEERSLADWHRLAQSLPPVGEEDLLEEELAQAVHEGYLDGEIPLDGRRPDLWWRGSGRWVEPGGRPGSGMVTADASGLHLGGLLRKRAIPWEEAGDWDLDLEAIELSVRLGSSSASVELSRQDLWERRRRAGR